MGTEAFVRAAAVKKERSSIGRCFNKTKKQKEGKKEKSYSHIFGVERFLKCIFVVARTSLHPVQRHDPTDAYVFTYTFSPPSPE